MPTIFTMLATGLESPLSFSLSYSRIVATLARVLPVSTLSTVKLTAVIT